MSEVSVKSYQSITWAYWSLLASLFSITALDAATPTLRDILPRGGQQGSTLEVRITGAYLSDTEEIFFHTSGIEAEKIIPDTDQRLKAVLKIAADAKLGQHEMRILEVGLGGRFDATNVVSPDLSIITSIGRDHMDRLGGTLEQVAFEKAGVLRPGIPAVLGATAADYIQHEPSWVMGDDAQWSIDERSFSWECSTRALQLELPGAFPAGAEESLSMAIVAADFLLQPAESGRLDLAKAAALAQWPARMQLVREDPTVLVDGAHNEPAMRWLRRAVKGRLPDEGVHIVAGFRPDKDITSMIKILAPLGSSWTFVQDQGGFLRAPADYVDSLRPYLSGPIHETNAPVWDVIQDIVDPTLVCGSLYLCGELLAQMGLNRSLETLD